MSTTNKTRDNLDTKNGNHFEASDEYLYIKKIEELQSEIDANEAFHIRVLKQAAEIGRLRNEIADLQIEIGRLNDEILAIQHEAGHTIFNLREALLAIRNTSYTVSKSYEIADNALQPDAHLCALESWK